MYNTTRSRKWLPPVARANVIDGPLSWGSGFRLHPRLYADTRSRGLMAKFTVRYPGVPAFAFTPGFMLSPAIAG
ncbi:MAG: hypothetical protein JST84_06700 [Acidobacteria bacterium]|nr:hypothetical protein [Acidobacteriota bacterium]